MNLDPLRLGSALLLVMLYLSMCGVLLRARRSAPVSDTDADWLVAYASQTGTGELLAAQTVATLNTGGVSARALNVEQLDAAALAAATRILFITSTYGEGDAPDSAAGLAPLLAAADLARLHYGLLALGDSSYTHFCGYGRGLDAALQARGAQPLFPRIEADRMAPGALSAWQHQLSHLIGTSDAADWSAPAYGDWRIVARTLINPGSAGAPVHRIRLRPASGALPAWQAGDLAQVAPPQEPERPREYSIASVSAEGCLELLVRLHLRDDGASGLASGWLCGGATPDTPVALRLRSHQRFQLGQNAARPLILIGNGTGIAGLRAHLQQRIAAGAGPNWLLFGERHAATDFFYRDEILAWQASGALTALTLAFSRDGGALRYVQDGLLAHAGQLRAWVADGAAIYVCGSLHGMGEGVHAALTTVLGEDYLARLRSAGRYRRDVY